MLHDASRLNLCFGFPGKGMFLGSWLPSILFTFRGKSHPRKKKSNFIFFALPPSLQNTRPPLLFIRHPRQLLRSGITCACFWEINWNVHRGDRACLHFSSSLYRTICHVSKLESELGFITHPACSHRHPRCALNGSASADDRRRRGVSSPPRPLCSTSCPGQSQCHSFINPK